MTTARLIFDGRCGVCTRTAGWLRRLDRHDRITTVPLQAPGAPESVSATEAECLADVQWRGADGIRRRGAEAVNAALATALGSRVPLVVYCATARVQDRAYAWFAANRHRFRGVTPHCDAEPGDCAS